MLVTSSLHSSLNVSASSPSSRLSSLTLTRSNNPDTSNESEEEVTNDDDDDDDDNDDDDDDDEEEAFDESNGVWVTDGEGENEDEGCGESWPTLVARVAAAVWSEVEYTCPQKNATTAEMTT